MFSVDQMSAGAQDWLELTYRLAAGDRLAQIIGDLMGKHNLPHSVSIYARMKQALAPVLEADDAALRKLGISLDKHTATALAEACAKFC